jgi:hypothetical protein
MPTGPKGEKRPVLGLNMPLPVPCEVRRDALAHGEARNTVRLVAVAHAPMILAP